MQPVILRNHVLLKSAGISGDNNFQLEFVNTKGIESVVPVSKVFFVLSNFGLKANNMRLLNHLQSLWTTSVETAAEYCRIVWDLFPLGKYVSVTIAQIIF